MRILFTGFDPFGGEKINPAGEAVKMMKNEIQGAEILKLEVPTVFGKAGEVLKKAVEQYRPDAVVCVGQAGGRAAITPEMIAVNIMDARIPDNAGNKPCHELIIKEGREAYFSSLPVKDIEKNLNDNGIPSSVSYVLYFLYRGCLIAQHLEDNFMSYAAFGLTLIVVIQAYVNIAVVIGLFPITDGNRQYDRHVRVRHEASHKGHQRHRGTGTDEHYPH